MSRYVGRIVIAVKPEVVAKLKSLNEGEIWLAGLLFKEEDDRRTAHTLAFG